MNKFDALIKARQSVGMTQQELADRSGVHQTNISNIENGVYNPSVKILKRLADGMGMKLCIEFKEKEDE